MTGSGARFRAAGYDRLKPFIEIHGKPMIEWVVSLFGNDKHSIIFICRKSHLENLDYMRKELTRIAPQATIMSLDHWQKKGPVNDILRISQMIDNQQAVIVSYCDYYMHWDYQAFKNEVIKRNCDGAVPCYSGFHPHLNMPKNLYASCKVDEREYLIEIKEKFSWEADKSKARHSPGIYYFKNGSYLKKYYQELIDVKNHIEDEYYASLPYNYLVRDGLKVWCPVNVDHFCQWGTPEDLKEHLFWIKTIQGFAR